MTFPPASGRTVAVALLAVCVALLLAACGGGGGGGAPEGAAPEASDHADEWPAPNGDLANTRNATSDISSDNVDELGIAWTAPITAKGTFGGYASTPIVADGVVYTQDLQSNVQAYDLESGKLKWRHDYDSANLGPNGVTIGYDRVYGATTNFAFALDKETGDEVWQSQRLTRNDREGIDMAPAVFDHTVYVSTVPGNAKGFYKGDGVGVLWALDADTGDKRWTFNTVPMDLWSPEHRDVNSGGGLWHPPAFDDDGDVYAAIANPAPWPGTKELPWGTSRPGPNLFTNSVVKLDRETGKLQWHRQVLAHDVYDWDLQLPPMLVDDGDRQLVIAAGKVGYVYGIDADSGDLVWKTAVGRHNGHDDDNRAALSGELAQLPELPVTVYPGALGGVETQMATADGVVYAPVVDLATTYVDQETPKLDFASGKGEVTALSVSSGEKLWTTQLPSPPYGAATVSNDLVFTTTFDGKLLALDRETGKIVSSQQLPAGTNAPLAIVGDTLVTAASYAQGKSQRAQIVAYRLGATGSAQTGPAETGTTGTTTGGGGQAAGESVFRESCATCHTLAAADATGSVGPNLDELKPAADTVEQQVRNGGGGMPAFEGKLSDAQIQAVADYVAKVAGQGGGDGGGGGTP